MRKNAIFPSSIHVSYDTPRPRSPRAAHAQPTRSPRASIYSPTQSSFASKTNKQRLGTILKQLVVAVKGKKNTQTIKFVFREALESGSLLNLGVIMF